MATFDISNAIVLLLAAALAGLLVALLPAWRRIMAHGRELPLWKFTRSMGATRDALARRIGERAVSEAEMRCGACAADEECAQRLMKPAATPPAHCPNAALFPSPNERH